MVVSVKGAYMHILYNVNVWANSALGVLHFSAFIELGMYKSCKLQYLRNL